MGDAMWETAQLPWRPFDLSDWCSEWRAAARVTAGMIVFVTEGTDMKRRWLLTESMNSRARLAVFGGAESVGPMDPRYQAVLGKTVGDREMYQWAGRVREVLVESMEPVFP